jgi:hypothetical protein
MMMNTHEQSEHTRKTEWKQEKLHNGGKGNQELKKGFRRGI